MKLAIISDIHSDLVNLQKALLAIEKLKCDELVCLGDIVGYSHHYTGHLDGRDGNECIRHVKELCSRVVCGNHDLNAVHRLPAAHRSLGMPENWNEMTPGERTAACGQRFWIYDDELPETLLATSREFLEGLDEIAIIRAGEFGILLTHFVFPDLTGNLQRSPTQRKDFIPHLKKMKAERCLVGLTGHAHLEGYARISRKNYEMKYFRRTALLPGRQMILVPAITRSPKSRSGFLMLDSGAGAFEAIPLE